MKLFKKGQGATEYLLMLAAVLVIVAIAVYYVTSSGGGPTMSFTAENVGDSVRLDFKTGTSSVAGDWEWAIVSGGTVGSWSTDSTNIEAGSTITVTATADAGDTFRIRIDSAVYDQTIV